MFEHCRAIYLQATTAGYTNSFMITSFYWMDDDQLLAKLLYQPVLPKCHNSLGYQMCTLGTVISIIHSVEVEVINKRTVDQISSAAIYGYVLNKKETNTRYRGGVKSAVHGKLPTQKVLK